MAKLFRTKKRKIDVGSDEQSLRRFLEQAAWDDAPDLRSLPVPNLRSWTSRSLSFCDEVHLILLGVHLTLRIHYQGMPFLHEKLLRLVPPAFLRHISTGAAAAAAPQ